MTPEDRQKLYEKGSANTARLRRPAVAQRVAEAIGISPAEVTFADQGDSDRAAELFGAGLDTSSDLEYQNGESAQSFVSSILDEDKTTAYLLVNDHHNCGAVKLSMQVAVKSVAALLQADSCFRVVSSDGSRGAYVGAGESSCGGPCLLVNVWNVDGCKEPVAPTAR